jgi:hypothetical protein
MIEFKLNRIILDGKPIPYIQAYGENNIADAFYRALYRGDIKGLNADLYKEAYKIFEEKMPPKVFEHLKNTPFFIAPASSAYHYNCIGGLLLHSVNVMQKYEKMFGKDNVPYSALLLHDYGKAFIYKPNPEPFPSLYKNSQKYWKPFIIENRLLSIRDMTLIKMGELSGIFPYLCFRDEVWQAIAIHDNNWGFNSQNACYNYDNVSKIALEFQACDSLATKEEPTYDETNITENML